MQYAYKLYNLHLQFNLLLSNPSNRLLFSSTFNPDLLIHREMRKVVRQGIGKGGGKGGCKVIETELISGAIRDN